MDSTLQNKAEAGDREAQYELSWRLALGQGGPGDEALALEWLKKAAEGGHPLAQNNLAARYLAGDGLPQDLVAAYCWFQLAEEAGDRKAGKNRSTTESRLTPEELLQAETTLQEIRRKLRNG